MTDIGIFDRSTLLGDALPRWLAALQRQVSGDFAPWWGVDARLWTGADAPAGSWRVILKDDADDPADLGFHVLDNGVPEARVFVRATLGAGEPVSAVLSHEILEMLADPLASRIAPDAVHIVEVCDPCPATQYEIDAVPVGDFVTPAYFGFNADRRYDFRGAMPGPVDHLLPGGYIGYWNGTQWQQKFGMADGHIPAAALARAGRSGRTSWRARTPPRAAA